MAASSAATPSSACSGDCARAMACRRAQRDPSDCRIHRVVAPADGPRARRARSARRAPPAGAGGFRRGVSPVEESVHGNARDSLTPRQIQHREQVRLVAVHAAGREQAEQVQGTAGRLRRGAGAVSSGLAKKLPSAMAHRCGSTGRRRHPVRARLGAHLPSGRPRAGPIGSGCAGSRAAARSSERGLRHGVVVRSSRWPQPSRMSRAWVGTRHDFRQ